MTFLQCGNFFRCLRRRITFRKHRCILEGSLQVKRKHIRITFLNDFSTTWQFFQMCDLWHLNLHTIFLKRSIYTKKMKHIFPMPIFYGFLNATSRGLKLQLGSWIHDITWVRTFNVKRDTSARGEVKLVTSL